MSYLIVPADGQTADFPSEIMRRRAHDVLPGVVEVVDRPGKRYDVLLHVEPADGSAFTIRREGTGQSVTTDGLLEQAAHVAAWARRLLPEQIPVELQLINQAYDHGVTLHYGITPEQVLAGWAPLHP